MNVGAVVGVLIVLGFIGAIIGSAKGHGGAGFLLGLVLGPIGWLIVAVMDRTPEAEAQHQQATAAAMGAGVTRRCPHCAETIQAEAVVCKHCGRDVVPLAAGTPGAPAGWFPDPSGRHPDRYWNGEAWTHWVRDKPGGTRSEDIDGARQLYG